MSLQMIPTDTLKTVADTTTKTLREVMLYRGTIKQGSEEDIRLNNKADELIHNRKLINQELQSREVDHAAS